MNLSQFSEPEDAGKAPAENVSWVKLSSGNKKQYVMFKPNPIISLVNMMCYLKNKKVLKVTVKRIKNILTKKILIYKIL